MSQKTSPLMTTMTPLEIKSLRQKLNLTQIEFWAPLGVTQSAGSRYELNRNIPITILMLMRIIYVSDWPSEDITRHKQTWGLK